MLATVTSEKLLLKRVARRGNNTLVFDRRQLAWRIVRPDMTWLALWHQSTGTHIHLSFISMFLLHCIIIGYLNVLLGLVCLGLPFMLLFSSRLIATSGDGGKGRVGEGLGDSRLGKGSYDSR